jgi:heptosyltransferase-2
MSGYLKSGGIPLKILIIDWLYIGDLVFATPFIRQLRAAYPDAEIDIMVREQNKEIFLHNPFLNHVIGVDRNSFQRRPIKTWRMIRTIRAQKYTMVINMQTHERTTIFAAFSGAQIIAGRAHKGPLRKWYTHFVPENKSLHQAENYLQILDALKIPRSPHQGYEVFIDEQTRLRAETLWQEAGLNRDVKAVGIHVGSNWLTKRWTTEGYINLCRLLCKAGLTPVFFGGPQDVTTVNKIIQDVPCKAVVFTGKTSLLEFTYLAGKCSVFVSSDSGPAHLAASQKTPVAIIFGPTSPHLYAPIYSPHVVLRSEVPCLECKKKACADHQCMKALKAEKVFEAVLQLMDGSLPPKP